MSLVQTPDTAKFDGMPRSAIAADMADHCLRRRRCPRPFFAIVRHGYPPPLRPRSTSSAKKGETTLEQVLELLRAHAGHDFGGYKRST